MSKLLLVIYLTMGVPLLGPVLLAAAGVYCIKRGLYGTSQEKHPLHSPLL